MASAALDISKIDLAPLRLEFSYRGLAAYPPGATFGPRTLDDYEMVWIIDGGARWTCDGRTVDAPPGTLILARPGMRDEYRWDPKRTSRHAYFHFSVVLNGGVLPPEETWPVVTRATDDDVVPSLFRHLLWLWDQRTPGWEDLAENAARHIFLSFVTRSSRTSLQPDVDLPDAVSLAVAEVRDRWWRGGPWDAPSLSALARAASVSEGHLCRVFRKTLGCGPVEAFRLLRLERAARLFARSNMSVQEVARITGFANQFHLSRAFRHVYGAPPRVYRTSGGEPRWPAGLRRVAPYVLGTA